MRRGPAMGFTVKKGSKRVLKRASEKGVSRRCLEHPLGEHDPVSVRPSVEKSCESCLKSS